MVGLVDLCADTGLFPLGMKSGWGGHTHTHTHTHTHIHTSTSHASATWLAAHVCAAEVHHACGLCIAMLINTVQCVSTKRYLDRCC